MNFAVAASLALLASGDGEGLVRATKKAAELDNYSFKSQTRIDGGHGKGNAKPITGKFEKDAPCSLESGKTHVYREGARLVFKWREVWMRSESAAKKDKSQDKEAKKFLQMISEIGALRAPHQELSQFEEYLAEVREVDAPEENGVVFEGTLTPEGAQRLVSGDEKTKGDLTYSGTARVWLTAEESVAKYEVTIKITGRKKGKDVNQTVTRTVEIFDVGTTKVEVEEAARSLLDEP